MRRKAFIFLAGFAAFAFLIAGSALATAQRRDYPNRPPADPAAVERGKALYGVNCQFCHGADTRGGDGGPSLLRSGIVLDDQHGELIAPVVRDADGKRLRLIAREIRDLAGRARSKQLGPDEIIGGTFTITNMGPFGTFMTLPIINQPQVAILATDSIRRRPVVVEGPDGDDAVGIHPVGVLALTWDHRAFDGAYAASFLHTLREILETRDWEPELA